MAASKVATKAGQWELQMVGRSVEYLAGRWERMLVAWMAGRTAAQMVYQSVALKVVLLDGTMAGQTE
jgi:hypothetical protein